MSKNSSKLTGSSCAVLMAVITSVFSACQATKTLPSETSSVSFYREALRAFVNREQPWKPMRVTRDNTEDPVAWRNQMYRFEFRPGEDDAGSLLEAARKGDAIAMSKLDFYVLQLDPNWSHRFEIKKMLAMRRGLEGIARFYSEIKNIRRLREDYRAIELALQQIESGAERGSLTDAVVLYQFCGTLAETPHQLPACTNLSASAKALELIAAHHGSIALKNVVAFEVIRLGYGRQMSLSGDYYPHTPQGWAPSHALNHKTEALNLIQQNLAQ
jgi:hypothetical protein